ncbi:MAG: cytidine deaminase [Opitutales bacterium]
MATESAQATLQTQLQNPEFDGYLEKPEPGQALNAATILEQAAQLAQVPISGFRVGAFARGASGRCYLGANLEFTGVPLSSSLHAEQSAVLNAWMHGESGIEALHVSAQPCGHCLQFLQELDEAGSLRLFVDGHEHRLSDFLPHPFALCGSGGSPGLFHRAPHPLVALKPTEDTTAQRAINAASQSYCPYSHSYEGMVLETVSGRFFAGRAVESAAFNPSIPPIVAALNQRNLSAWRFEAISRAIHAKLATALNHSLPLSEAILKTIASALVEVLPVETEAHDRR